MQYNRVLQNYSDELEKAKQTVVTLAGDSADKTTLDLFYEKDLTKIEQGIKRMNDLSTKLWLVSAITLYSMIYDQELYKQSGLEWNEYLKQSRDRLGMESRDISEQLSSARFFIKYQEKLIKAGWLPNKGMRSLARAEHAVELSGSVKDTIQHLANDSWREFKEWYTTYKLPSAVIPPSKHEIDKKKVEYSKGTIKINGKNALTVADDLDPSDKKKLESYMLKIAEALKEGYEPAIIPVYDTNEANVLIRLRDKNRQGK